ncbi:LOW QUALITY PROTEIN: Hypothetical protein PHPALM_17345 [Phytophthora palmivora]|uniref:Uncharacterized protein n=1 Tax=Phytophthora palmivora TaxID=4796 RepID=A0A2P4XMF9_9STRA|nr:LOW QUALITY PROTEIN: Hypothetical protein PHPALM_17345 [Phytophthora palmivora]
MLDRVARITGVSDARRRTRSVKEVRNTCDGLTQRWIFDRGAWNISTTNQEFDNLFKANQEDHKQSISGYGTETNVKAVDFKPFNVKTQEKIASV